MRKLDKKTLMADKSIAGFQKLSIIHLPGTTAVHMNARHTHKGCPAAGSRGHSWPGMHFTLRCLFLFSKWADHPRVGPRGSDQRRSLALLPGWWMQELDLQMPVNNFVHAHSDNAFP